MFANSLLNRKDALVAMIALEFLHFQVMSFLRGWSSQTYVSSGSQHEFTLDSSFLDGIRDLYALFIEGCTFTSLSQATQPLRNLNTLLLYLSLNVQTLSIVGDLVNLDVLICRECHSIEELPLEMKGLNLNVLELTCCYKLQ